MLNWLWLSTSGAADGEGQDQAPAEAEPQLSAEEIRRRRLERLAGSSGAGSPGRSGDSKSQHATSAEAFAPAPAPAPAAPAPPAPAPARSEGSPVQKPRSSPKNRRKSPQKPGNAAAGGRSGRPAPTAASPPKRKPASPSVPLLERCLQLSVDSSGSDPSLFLVDAVAEPGKKLVVDDLDIAIQLRIRAPPASLPQGQRSPPLEYLHRCHARLGEHRPTEAAQTNSAGAAAERLRQTAATIQEARLVVVNSALSFLLDYEDTADSDMPWPRPDVGEFVASLASSPSHQPFCTALFAAAEEQERAEELARPALDHVLREAALSRGMEGRATAVLPVLASLCAFKAVPKALARHSAFPVPAGSGKGAENTALGVFLSATPISDHGMASLFPDVQRLTLQRLRATQSSVRSQLAAIQDSVFTVLMSMLRAGGETRQAGLAWVQDCLAANAAREQTRPDPNTVASHGLMLNLMAVLLRVADKFLDPHSPKADKLDLGYHLSDAALFPRDDTRLLPDVSAEEAAAAAASAPPPSSHHFMTRVYFLALRCLHLGPLPCTRELVSINQHADHLRRAAGSLDEPASTPQQRMAQQQLLSLQRRMLVTETQLLDDALMQPLLRLCTLTAGLLRRHLGDPTAPRSGEDTQSGSPSLPLARPDAPSLLFLPEHIVGDWAEALLFLGQAQTVAFDEADAEGLLDFVVAVLASPHLVHSPHLRAKFGELLYQVYIPHEDNGQRPAHLRERLVSIRAQGALAGSERARQHLMQCLVELYGDVEHTGFYDKTMHRFRIMQVMRHLWGNVHHRAAFKDMSERSDVFLRFAHGILNHTDNLVADALSKLPDVKATRDLMQDEAQWRALSDAEREQCETALQDNERTVTGSLQLANETVTFLSLMTAEVQGPLLTDELRDRVGSMLASVISRLAGPRGVALKVADPESYNFRPREMLRDVVTAFANLSVHKEFLRAVAASSYYEKPVFAKALAIQHRIRIVSEDTMAKFDRACHQLEELAQELEEEEEALQDVPDEYLDALVFTIMRDPVRLPSSGMAVDRTTIRQHLLNDETDPFNRDPLTEDQVESLPKLRDEIQAWLASKGKARQTS